MVLGLALRVLRPVVRGMAAVVAPIAALLAWGAVENGLDRRNGRQDAGRGVH